MERYASTAVFACFVRSTVLFRVSKSMAAQGRKQIPCSGILCQPSDKISTPKCVIEVIQYLKLPVVNLPTKFHCYFDFKKVTISESDFVKFFFQNLTLFEPILTTRSEIIQRILEVYAAEYDDETERSYMLHNYLVDFACIPCTPDGKVLRKCNQVVDYNSSFSPLFDESESYFPIKILSERYLCETSLNELGMISKTIPCDLLVERAQSVLHIYSTDKQKALKRAKLILSSCTKIVSETASIKGKKVMKSVSHQHSVCKELASVPFLPVLPRPEGYFFPWKGDGQKLMCGKDLFVVGTERYRGRFGVNPLIAGSQVVFLNESSVEKGGCGYINQDALSIMGIQRSSSIEDAIAQLSEVQLSFESQLPSKDLVSNVDKICCQIYDFLNSKLQASSSEHQKQVQHLHLLSVWNGKTFVDSNLVASDWLGSHDGPYLYKTPVAISSNKYLLESLQLKKQFSLKDIENALISMKQCFKNEPIDEHCQIVFNSIVALLQQLDLTTAPILMLPDKHFVLHKSNTLAYNEVDWAPKDSKYIYVHEDIIPSGLAKKLGVISTRSKMIEKFLGVSASQFQSIEFGQREDLTRRIQNILRDYPFDITFLKELLQNADDAKATKMYIILDRRTHGNKGILSENWKKLQGPALLVWNDSVFSEKDLTGIQELGLGSKHSDYDSIGQYGIGFNVVYHITDCPSFITGGETLCVLDPHCKYLHEANKLFPGRRYEGLSTGFWKHLPDMKSAYLQSGLENSPPELSSGTLFRFPLRNTKEYLMDSKIVPRNAENVPQCDLVTSSSMYQNLIKWAHSMKEAMLFLNSVTELKFFCIEEEGNLIHTMKECWTVFDGSGERGRKELSKALSDFNKKKGNTSIIVRYPLNIKESYRYCGKAISTEEKWLIQQGVGDIENEQQTWSFIETVKPRHGIAAPILLTPPPKHDFPVKTFMPKDDFKGKVFCFLPLPLFSKLPVHINGNFILNSTRRNLWNSSGEGREDNRSVWNNQLFQAISSSYAVLLENAQSSYVSTGSYKTVTTANNDVQRYYEIFPSLGQLDSQFRTLAKGVYEKLITHNQYILAEIAKLSTDQSKLKVVWHPPKSHILSTQVYFWSSLSSLDTFGKQKELEKIFQSFGLKLTKVNTFIQDGLNGALEEDSKIEEIWLKTVDLYYSNNCHQISKNGQFPCLISDTVFRDVCTFKLFSDYLLQTFVSTTDPPDLPLKFPNEPFGCPLLLTADNQLRRFDKNVKVINSEFSSIFPNSQEFFLHPEMINILYSSEYYLSSSDDESWTLINRILSNHLPSCLINTKRVLNFLQILSKDVLVQLWRCFSNDNVFCSNLPNILKHWSLIPSTSGSLHAYSDTLVPVNPTTCTQEENDGLYKVLQEAGMPILDITIVGTAELNCPVISEVDKILKALFHLNQEKDLSTIIGKNITTIVSFIKKINFRNDVNSLFYVKSLPLFECVNGVFKSLNGKEAYVWPYSVSTVGFVQWSGCVPDVIFLSGNGKWALSSLETLEIKTISPEELYSKFIFKHFHVLSEHDRYQHLVRIREDIFDIATACAKQTSKSKQIVQKKLVALTFLNDLKKLCCIGDDDLKPVSSYCNHEMDIFNTFNEYFLFLPDFFKHSPSWSDWLTFFKQLGLKCQITQEEFLLFCNDISQGKQKDLVYASNILLNTLFSNFAKEAQWYQNPIFLEEVNKISFVLVLYSNDLVWIRKGHNGSHTVIVEDKQYL